MSSRNFRRRGQQRRDQNFSVGVLRLLEMYSRRSRRTAVFVPTLPCSILFTNLRISFSPHRFKVIDPSRTPRRCYALARSQYLLFPNSHGSRRKSTNENIILRVHEEYSVTSELVSRRWRKTISFFKQIITLRRLTTACLKMYVVIAVILYSDRRRGKFVFSHVLLSSTVRDNDGAAAEAG